MRCSKSSFPKLTYIICNCSSDIKKLFRDFYLINFAINAIILSSFSWKRLINYISSLFPLN
ncbi:hypothetical protein CW304_20755 [Bacillus sp. UFRGS-B20]|nr:hypothetical protein CW304_20755 [Bacillus sp. UFRGS-B20]